MSNIPTTFAIILTVSVRENTAAYEWDGKGICPQYWKNKGNEEIVVREGLSVTDVMEMGSKEIQRLVLEAFPKSDEYYSYDTGDYQLVELNSALIAQVNEYLESDQCSNPNDPTVYVEAGWDLKLPKYATKWAMKQYGHYVV